MIKILNSWITVLSFIGMIFWEGYLVRGNADTTISLIFFMICLYIVGIEIAYLYNKIDRLEKLLDYKNEES